MPRFCPYCGKEVAVETKFCGACGKELLPKPLKGFTVASGVITIIASCGALLLGYSLCMGLVGFIEYPTPPELVGVGFFLSLIIFALGVTAGILILQRRVFPFAVTAISLIILFGALMMACFVLTILGILSMIFLALSRKSFR